MTGSQIVVADSGTFTITSQRAVYVGQRKTFDMPYAKLEAVNVFTDGVQFHLPNCQNPPVQGTKRSTSGSGGQCGSGAGRPSRLRQRVNLLRLKAARVAGRAQSLHRDRPLAQAA